MYVILTARTSGLARSPFSTLIFNYLCLILQYFLFLNIIFVANFCVLFYIICIYLFFESQNTE